jgi:hypothetical protein
MHTFDMRNPPIATIRRVLSEPADAERLHAAIGTAGGLDEAISLASHDQARPLLDALLALRSALEEEADPALRAARLRTRARALDHRADRLFAEAAEFFGKAAYRRARAEAALAEDFQRRAEAAEAAGEALYAQAAAQRLVAAAGEGRLFRARAVAAVAA